jgi:hypothetical protein
MSRGWASVAHYIGIGDYHRRYGAPTRQHSFDQARSAAVVVRILHLSGSQSLCPEVNSLKLK